jgi:IclR family acetate operon transcriptional repressor
MAADPPNKSAVQSVERAFELLEIMASAGGTIALGELAARAELPQPTIHRLVRTLLAMGYVRQLPNRHYSLGPKLIRLGESAAQLIGAWSRQHLAELVERTGETANMAVLDSDMAVYVAQVPSPHAMRMFTEVGRRVYPHCTGVGKALLMQLPNESVVDAEAHRHAGFDG